MLRLGAEQDLPVSQAGDLSWVCVITQQRDCNHKHTQNEFSSVVFAAEEWNRVTAFLFVLLLTQQPFCF